MGIEVMADTLSRFVPVYQYIFSFEDPSRPSWYKPMRGSGLGIPHFDDMPYFFPKPPAGDSGEWSEATLTTHMRLLSMWSTCCKSPANNRGQEQDVNLRADMEPAQPRGEDLLEHHQGAHNGKQYPLLGQ